MINHFDFLAPFYNRAMGEADLEKYKELLHLPVNGWMLDAGGGTGRISFLLRNLVDGLVVNDVSRRMLMQLKKNMKLYPIQAFAEQLPFPDESFSRILVVDAFHHFHNQRQAVTDLLRVLKSGGRLVIEEPDINRFAVKLVAIAEKLALMRSSFYAATEIRAMLQQNGQTAVIQNGSFSNYVIVDKPMKNR